jgi:hypothetical protein
MDANTVATKCRRYRLPVQDAGVSTAARGQVRNINRKGPGGLAQFHPLYHQFNRLCGIFIDF